MAVNGGFGIMHIEVEPIPFPRVKFDNIAQKIHEHFKQTNAIVRYGTKIIDMTAFE